MSKRRKSFLSYIIVFITFLFMQPFIIWPSYSLYSIFLILEYVLLIFGIVIIFRHAILGKHTIKLDNFKSFIILALICMYFYITGQETQIGRWGVMLQYIFLSLLILVDDDVIKLSLNRIALFMAILLIPALIVLILRYVGVGVPYSVIADYKEGNRVFLHYPFSVATSNINSMSIVSLRLNGMFDEPGALGTFLALILFARKYDLRSKINIILFISGCLTLSTAFLIVFLFFIATSAIESIENRKKNIRKDTFVFILLIMFSALTLIIMDIEILQSIWTRFFFKFYTDDYLRGSNVIFKRIIQEVANHPSLIFFGQGYATSEFVDSGSVLMLFYKVGIIGIILSLIYVFFVKLDKKKIMNDFSMRMAMVLVLIQRPYILMVPYVVFFIMGLCNYKNYEVEIVEKIIG